MGGSESLFPLCRVMRSTRCALSALRKALTGFWQRQAHLRASPCFALLRPATLASRETGAGGTSSNGTCGTEGLRGDLSTKNPQQQPWLFALMQTGCIRRRCGCFALRLHPTIHSYRHAHIRPRSGTEEWGPVRSHLRRGLAFGRHGALRECRAGLRALL